ncbi:MAG: Rid family detoxifying hydrolase [Chloroflexota bacterium]
MKQEVRIKDAPAPAGSYSQAIVAGGFVFVSGQRPVDALSGEMPASVGDQTHQVLRNIELVLAAAGATLDDVVKVTTYLADVADFAEYNSVYTAYFREPYPARTTVGAQLRGILIEIDVVALCRS